MTNDPLRSIERIISQRRDAALVKSALEGERASFEKLIVLHKKRVVALGMNFFHNADDAEDFAQDVFVKAYTNLRSFRGEAAFSTWITRIAYNTAVNSVNRAHEYLPLVNEEIVPDKKLTPEEEHIRQVTVAAVRRALAELPEKYAVCIELYFFHDLSYTEIEAVTAFPINTIKSHIFRAKKILRESLRGFYEN